MVVIIIIVFNFTKIYFAIHVPGCDIIIIIIFVIHPSDLGDSLIIVSNPIIILRHFSALVQILKVNLPFGISACKQTPVGRVPFHVTNKVFTLVKTDQRFVTPLVVP